MKPFIDNYADILDFLDEKVDSINWDNLYKETPECRLRGEALRFTSIF